MGPLNLMWPSSLSFRWGRVVAAGGPLPPPGSNHWVGSRIGRYKPTQPSLAQSQQKSALGSTPPHTHIGIGLVHILDDSERFLVVSVFWSSLESGLKSFARSSATPYILTVPRVQDLNPSIIYLGVQMESKILIIVFLYPISLDIPLGYRNWNYKLLIPYPFTWFWLKTLCKN